MLVFWSLVACISVVSAWLLARPVSRAASANSEENERLRISVFRENLQELETELATGELDSDQLSNVKTEMELTLLQQVKTGGDDNSRSGSKGDASSNKTVLATATLLVCLSLILYFYLGNPQLIKMSQLAGQNVYSENPDEYQPTDQMTTLMEQHLDRNPQDVNGLYFLASNYIGLSDYKSAAGALERLYQISGDSPQVLISYIDVLVKLNNGSFSGRPSELIQRALMVAPNNYSALLFAGLAAEEEGDYRKANGYYKRLVPAVQGNPQLLATINMLISNTEMMMQETGTDESSPAPTQTGPDTSITVSVKVAENLSNEFEPGDTLFVYAQAVDGSPMPLAVYRTQAGELPLDVTLDDSLSMMPAYRISGFDEVRIQARISKSGNAEASSGDLVGVLESVPVDGRAVTSLVIDERIQ